MHQLQTKATSFGSKPVPATVPADEEAVSIAIHALLARPVPQKVNKSNAPAKPELTTNGPCKGLPGPKAKCFVKASLGMPLATWDEAHDEVWNFYFYCLLRRRAPRGSWAANCKVPDPLDRTSGSGNDMLFYT